MRYFKLGFLFVAVTLLASFFGGCAPVPYHDDVVIIVVPEPHPHPDPWPRPRPRPRPDPQPNPVVDDQSTTNIASKTQERLVPKTRGPRKAERSPVRNTPTSGSKKRNPVSGKTKTR